VGRDVYVRRIHEALKVPQPTALPVPQRNLRRAGSVDTGAAVGVLQSQAAENDMLRSR